MTGRYIFIGEKRSHKAQVMGVTWTDGRLAARTLHEALRAMGIEPSQQTYVNLWCDDGSFNPVSLGLAAGAARNAVTVVGLGAKVQRELNRAGIGHIALIHPAARGAIRRKAAYHAHVAEQLGCGTAVVA